MAASAPAQSVTYSNPVAGWFGRRTNPQLLAAARVNPYLATILGIGRWAANKWGQVDPAAAPLWSYNGLNYNQTNGATAPDGSSYTFGSPPTNGPHTPPPDPAETWKNFGWATNGSDFTDPFGQLAGEGPIQDSISSKFDWPAGAGSSGSNSSTGGPRRGGYNGNPYLTGMSVTQLDLGNGMTMPVIQGPQWVGPQGLPWTQGADPKSYPYSYIPPNGSWEGVDWFHLPQGSGGYNPAGGGAQAPQGPNRGMLPTRSGQTPGSGMAGMIGARDMGGGVTGDAWNWWTQTAPGSANGGFLY